MSPTSSWYMTIVAASHSVAASAAIGGIRRVCCGPVLVLDSWLRVERIPASIPAIMTARTRLKI